MSDKAKNTAEDMFGIDYDNLLNFCVQVFQKLGLDTENAELAANVLVAADVRGMPSHGVGRLWRYVNGLKTGQMIPDACEEVLMDTPASLVVNANGGMGAPVSIRTMKKLIEKAEHNGAAFGCVRDSNHFGIAGYYAMLALEHDMLGIAMTNTAALGVPTFGRQVMFGTNPLAFCAPANQEKAFVLDMSTTVVSRGKIEVYDRKETPLKEGWAVNKTGKTATDARQILDEMFHRRGGGILPLGGIGEEFGGYKGYGLAVMVDILCSVLCGAPFGPDLSDTATSSARVSHFLGAVKIENFRDPKEFRKDMDKMLRQLRDMPTAEGEERVYFAGQKEFESEEKTMQNGIQLLPKTVDSLESIGEELGIDFTAIS